MLVEIVRETSLSSDSGEFGHLYVDGVLQCATCELPWRDNQRDASCIPEGEYQLLPFNSAAHGPTVVFHNPALGVYGTQEMIPADVSGARSLCEIHVANWPFQLRGCVGVGHNITDIPPNGRGVSRSADAFSALLAVIGPRPGLTARITSVEAPAADASPSSP